jgi:ABC-type phosphate transport system substrate-binding protein
MKLLFLIFLSFSSYGYSQSVYIVWNTKNISPTEKEVRDIFLGRKTYWNNGKRVLPASIEVENKSFQKFSDQTLEMSSRNYSKYWRRQLFSGRGTPPQVFSSDNEVINYVKNNSNSIGVVSTQPKNTSLKFKKLN